MKVDIWSDIRCPFCYIGKRKFEAALTQFEHKNDVQVSWHSFQLDPTLKYKPGKNVIDYLAEIKGQTREWSAQMHRQVALTAAAVGLTFNFDKAAVAGSFDALRLVQMADSQGLGDTAEEALFKAYFTEGKNISDHATLIQLGVEIGLDATEVELMLNGTAYTEEVHRDEARAKAIGVTGVPFYVLNDQYAISGAQSPEVFLNALEQAWAVYEKHPAMINAGDGDTCEVDGNC